MSKGLSIREKRSHKAILDSNISTPKNTHTEKEKATTPITSLYDYSDKLENTGCINSVIEQDAMNNTERINFFYSY